MASTRRFNEIIVSNVGKVYEGAHRGAAKAFNEYRYKSRHGVGRCAGETVMWYKDGDVHRQFVGTNDREAMVHGAE